MNGKLIDNFHFVNHPWLVADSTGHSLLDFGCDCPDARQKRLMCEHCVSLCLTWMEDSFDYASDCGHPDLGIKAADVKPAPVDTAATPSVPKDPDARMPHDPTEETIEERSCDVTDKESPDCPAAEIRSMEILLGEDSDGHGVLWRPNDTEQVFHMNMGIIGTMGTGKTQFAKSLLAQLYHRQQDNYNGHPLGILVFDYKGDYNETKRDFAETVNARVLKPYRLPYNPLALNPGKAFKPLLPMHTANEFKDTISQIYGLGPKQQHLLLDCIIKAYRKQGIDPADPATWGRRAPTIDQVYDIMTSGAADRPVDKLTTAMSKLHQFCLFEDDPRRAVSLDTLLDGVVVIDMAGYDSDIQSTIVAITLNQFYSRMQAQGSSLTDGKYRQLRKFIMVDEADTFMREGIPSLRRIMKEGREFGVGVILSTQSLDHYTGSDDNYSRYILTWAVHNVGDLTQKDVEYLFKLQAKSPEIARNYAIIRNLQKHESVVKLGNEEPIAIHNNAFYQLNHRIHG